MIIISILRGIGGGTTKRKQEKTKKKKRTYINIDTLIKDNHTLTLTKDLFSLAPGHSAGV